MENGSLENGFRATEATAENTEIQKIGITTLSPFCDSKCSVCDSGFAAEINALRSSKTLRELSEFLKFEYDIELTKDVLHNHFKKYGLKLRDESLKIAYQQFQAEANAVATHQKQTLFLASYTFEEILRRMGNGTLKVGIDDFEKLLKLYHQVLNNPSGLPADGLVETFMLAQRKWNIPVSQQSFDFRESTPEAPEAAPAPDMGRACAPSAGAA